MIAMDECLGEMRYDTKQRQVNQFRRIIENVVFLSRILARSNAVGMALFSLESLPTS